MLEMRTVLKKIKPEENCYRYYEMVLKEEGGQYVFEKRWGRLRYGLLPVNTKTMEQVFPERRTGLDQFMKTLSQKEKRGYILSDELRIDTKKPVPWDVGVNNLKK